MSQSKGHSALSGLQISISARERAQAFLAQASQFRLGDLPTEQPHPKTRHLSQLAHDDPRAALDLFKEVEIDAYRAIAGRLPDILELRDAIRAVLAAGGRIFLAGCGATGRLSLALETLWRQAIATAGATRQGDAERVFSFMAGGDYALVRSIENFEDHPEFGERQLIEAGFRRGDLLIACTEGGETPFVIGATVRAAREPGGIPPYFLYCNPDEILCRLTERSRQVINDPAIRKINLSVGPMAITGSTRLQATSVLMFTAGAALFHAGGLSEDPAILYTNLLSLLEQSDIRSLASFVEHEAALYISGQSCLHVSREHAISVLTDLTERSPTFSLPAFENETRSGEPAAWTYLEVPQTTTALNAWRTVLGRDPRALNWPQFSERYGWETVLGFDFSGDVSSRRATRLNNAPQSRYEISRSDNRIVFQLDGRKASFSCGPHLLLEHLLLKLALNASSTLVMGRAGRFEGNVMLWVKSSNNKLIDRSIRYIQGLLEAEDPTPFRYEDIAEALFATLENLSPDEPAVIKTRDFLRARQSKTDKI